jgi:hypothetical protein
MNMADNQNGGGSSPWVAFLAGIFLVAIVAVGIVAYNGGLQRQETAQLELNVPDVKINPPDVELPPMPAPQSPPTAEPATETP